MSFPFLKYAVANLFSKPSTRNFPAENVDAKPNYRGRIFYDGDKCINCGMCQKVCSPSAITTVTEQVEGGEKIHYTFDMTSCTFCGTCADFCEEKAIVMTDDYHMVGTKHEDFLVTGTMFKKAIQGELSCNDDCIYCTLCAKMCPNGAITVDRENKTWAVDKEKCTKCGICISKCPKKALSFAAPKLSCNDDCIYCTLCAKMCPNGAITVDRENKSWECDSEKCTQCGICISKCPKKSLSF